MSIRPLLPLGPYAGSTEDGVDQTFGVRFVRYADEDAWEAIFADQITRCACCGAGIKNVVVVDEDITRPMHGPGLDLYGFDCFARLFGSRASKAAREARNEWRRMDAVARRARDGWFTGLAMSELLTGMLIAPVEQLRARPDIVAKRVARAEALRPSIAADRRLHGRYTDEVLARLDELLAAVRARIGEGS